MLNETSNHITSVRSIVFIILGTLSFVFAINGFLLPNNFLAGGITGLSILISSIFKIEFIIPLVLINLPFFLIGYFKIGKSFTFHSLLAILLVAIFYNIIQLEGITKTDALTAAFGGFFIGLGLGLVIRAGGIIDGLEIIALYGRKKFGLTTSEIILAINAIIFLLITYELGIEKALFSILTYVTALKTSDYIVDGIEEYTGLTIISPRADEVKELIVKRFNKPITVYNGERGYLPGSFDIKHDCDIIITIVTRLELHKIKMAVRELDPSAFMYIQTIKEVKGGIIRKKRQYEL